MIAYLVQKPATGWKVWGSNTDWGEIIHTRPHQPWGPPNIVDKG